MVATEEVTEKIANHRDVDTSLQERNCTTVAHDVWGDSPFPKGGRVLSRQSDVFRQYVGDAIAR